MDRTRKLIINEMQPDMHPSEILHDAKKLLVVNYVSQIHNTLGLTPLISHVATTSVGGVRENSPGSKHIRSMGRLAAGPSDGGGTVGPARRPERRVDFAWCATLVSSR